MGTKLQVVGAGAGIAVSGSAHGERRVSGVRRAAPLWWFFPDRRVSAFSAERCQLQRASRATSERRKFPSQEIFEARSPCALPETAIPAPATATSQLRPLLLGNEECPHYTTFRQVTLPSSFTPVAVCPLKLSNALPSFSISVVVALPVVPLLARSARWYGSSAASGRVSIS